MTPSAAHAQARREAKHAVWLLRQDGARAIDVWHSLTDLEPCAEGATWAKIERLIAAIVYADLARERRRAA